MIKEVEQIKMRKDLQHLKNNFGFGNVSLAKIFGCGEKIIRDFTSSETKFLSDRSFNVIYTKLQNLKKDIKQAEEYVPNGWGPFQRKVCSWHN